MHLLTKSVLLGSFTAVTLGAGLTLGGVPWGAHRPAAAPSVERRSYGVESQPKFEISDGPETTHVFVGGGPVPGVKVKGTIQPNLPSPAGVSNVKVVCPNGEHDINPCCYTGAANDGVWNVQIQDGPCPGTSPPANCLGAYAACETIKITFTNGVVVSMWNPHKRGQASLEFGPFNSIPREETSVSVKVQSYGTLLSRYSGTVAVRVSSLHGSNVRMNGAYGVCFVKVTQGVGSFRLDTTDAKPGDTLFFDVEGDTLDTCRSSVKIDK